MKTEKRAAKVGEQVLITKELETFGSYKKGDIFTVAEVRDFNSVLTSEKFPGWAESGSNEDEGPLFLAFTEYEVIIDE